MDASEYFKHIVRPNYEESNRNPDDLRSLWNAVVSMNTVAEYVALDRLQYARPLPRSDIDQEANKIRQQYNILSTIKECAETFKHVRRHKGQIGVATSTGVSPDQPSTYQIGTHDLRLVLDQALSTVNRFTELK